MTDPSRYVPGDAVLVNAVILSGPNVEGGYAIQVSQPGDITGGAYIRAADVHPASSATTEPGWTATRTDALINAIRPDGRLSNLSIPDMMSTTVLLGEIEALRSDLAARYAVLALRAEEAAGTAAASRDDRVEVVTQAIMDARGVDPLVTEEQRNVWRDVADHVLRALDTHTTKENR